MWIRQVHIDRFGPLERRELTLPPAGLIAIEGPNEAGKSSLLDFLRVLLFGARGAGAMAASQGGWRGRAELVSQDGSALWVERAPRVVRLRDSAGAELAPSAFEALLGGTTRGLFRNVYAFGLTELQEIGSLKGDQVGAELLSAGLAGGVNLQQVLGDLKAQREKLYRPQGEKPPLNLAERAYAEASRAVARAEQEEGAWQRLVHEERRAQREAERLEAEHAALAQRHSQLDRLAALWPDWSRWQACTALVAASAALADWPATAAVQAEEAGARAREALGAAADAEERLGRLERGLPDPALQGALADPAWQALVDEWPAIPRQREQAARLAGELSAARRQLEELAAQLGVDPAAEWPARAAQLADGLEALGQAAEAAERVRADAGRRLTEADEAAQRTWIRAEQRRVSRTRVLAAVPALAGAAAVLALLAGFVPPPWSWGAGVAGALAAAVAAWRVMSAGTSPGHLLPEEDAAEPAALAHARADHAAAVRAADRAQQQWARFWQDADMPALSVAGARLLLAQAPRWSELTVRIREIERALAAGQEAEERFWAAAAPVAARWQLSGERSLAVWQSWRDQRREWARLLQSRAEEQAALAAARERGQVAQAALEAVWAAVGAASAEQFQAELSRLAAWQAARQEEERLAQRLSADPVVRGLGSPFPRAFEPWTADALGGERERLAAARQALADQRDAALGELATARQARQRLEQSGTLAEARLRQAVAGQKLQQGLAALLELQWAEAAIQVAREALRTERQPQVMRDTAALYRRVTGGRYVNLWATDDESLEVQGADGQVYRAEVLSRGAKEQLYLAFRLAWIDEQSRRGREMPVLFDDILVNADPARQRVLADVLGAFAQRHQVLFLTCHPDQAALLAEAGAARRVALGAVS